MVNNAGIGYSITMYPESLDEFEVFGGAAWNSS